MVMVIIMARAPIVAIEAGGMSKWRVRFRFMTLPCLMKKVEDCAMHTPNVNEVNQMGTMLRTSFVSSTWVTVANFQGFGFSLDWISLSSWPSRMAALSRNLQKMNDTNEKFVRLLSVAHL